jgi:hypothetical protein
MGAAFSAILDFGPIMTEKAEVTVTGLTGIAVNSRAEAWFMRQATGDNNADQHEMAATFCKLSCGDNVANTSTLVKAVCVGASAIGQFQIEGGWF